MNVRKLLFDIVHSSLCSISESRRDIYIAKNMFVICSKLILSYRVQKCFQSAVNISSFYSTQTNFCHVTALKSQFQSHLDMINSLEMCVRNERLLILSASSDCSVQLWDIYGNHIGVFGQVSG